MTSKHKKRERNEWKRTEKDGVDGKRQSKRKEAEMNGKRNGVDGMNGKRNGVGGLNGKEVTTSSIRDRVCRDKWNESRK